MDNKERENFNRNSTLIVEHTKDSLTNLIDLNVTQGGYGSFEIFINAKQHDIYHLCYNKSRCCQCPREYTLPRARVIYPSQLDLLLSKNGPKKMCHNPSQTGDFCCCFPHRGLTTSVLDVTLAGCLLVNFCQDLFWYSCLTAQKQTLEDFLTRNKHHIYHLYDINNRCCQCPPTYVFPTQKQLITKKQWNLLFNTPCLPCQQDRNPHAGGPQTICAASVTPGITVGVLGADMSQLLIDHYCTLKKSIEKLVQLRNNVFGHIKEAKITDNNYAKYRYLIEYNLLLIARICNKEREVQHNLKDLDRRTLDGTLLMQLINDQLYTVGVMSSRMAEQSLDLKEHMDKRMKDMSTTLSSQIGQDIVKQQIKGQPENSSADDGKEISARSAVLDGSNSTECSDSRENATVMCEAVGGDTFELLLQAIGGDNSGLLSEAEGGDNPRLLSQATGNDISRLLSEATGGDNSILFSEAAGQLGHEHSSADDSKEISARPVVLDGSISTECSDSRENATVMCEAVGGDNSELLSQAIGGDNSGLLSEAEGGDNPRLLSDSTGGDNSILFSEAADRWRDKKKFFKLIEFSYDLSLNVVRAFIESNILKDYNNSLENFLNAHNHAIYHLWIFNTKCCIGTCTLNQNRELRKDQLTKLYDLPVTFTTGHYKKGRGKSVIQCCSCGINVRNTCSMKDLDIILIHTIIRHCVKLQPDEDMWLNTIRDIRNKLAHVESTTGFDEGRLERWWQKLEGSVLGLARKITPSCTYDIIESQVNLLKKSDFDIGYIQEILGKLKAEIKQFHDDITRDIRQVSRFHTDELIQHIKEVLKDVVVDIKNLSFKVATQGIPQLQIQNSNATDSCDFQDSNICYVRWKLDTPNSWQVQQLKNTLENVSAMLHNWFKVEFVHIGSLIIVTTVPKHVIMDNQSFEEAVRAFLATFVEVCGIDTNSPATVHVELTLLQDFNDLSTGDKDEDNLHSNVPPVVQEDKQVTEVELPITPVASQESSETKESQRENKQKDESETFQLALRSLINRIVQAGELDTSTPYTLEFNLTFNTPLTQEKICGVETEMATVSRNTEGETVCNVHLSGWKAFSQSPSHLAAAFRSDYVREQICDLETEMATVSRNTEERICDVETEMATVSRNTEDVREEICDVATEMATVSRNTADLRAETQNIEIEMGRVSRNTEGVRLKVEEMETKMSEVIPANIQDHIKKQLELWQKQDNMFVSTGATDHVLKCIKENSCVTVTGSSGVGKTFIVRHVALIMKGQGYTVIPTHIPKDIRDFTKRGSKTLFVIDDIGGHYTLDQKYLDDWKLMLSYITPLVMNNHCKIIATCRLQVFKDEKFKDLSIFISNECNLNSEKLCLTSDEKTNLAKQYFGDQASKVGKISDQYEFFPLLCSLYDKDKFNDLSLFLSRPFDCYKQELDHLLIEGDEGRYKYCVLALVVMFNNKLSEDHLSGDYSKIIKNTLDKCKLNKGTSVECLKDALHTLEGTFVVKDGDCYKTVHDKLFDFLAKYFGDKMLKCIIDNATSEFINERILWKTPDNTETDIEFSIYLPDNCLDMYISRLVNDWSDGKVYSLFCSRNLKLPTFIVKLLDHIKQHDKSFQVKLANVTVDSGYHNTTLLQSCFVGDVNLTQWILDNTVYNGRCDSIVNKCRDDGTSPVYIACCYGHLSVLDRLIECKADINKCKDNGASPVYIACQNGHLSVLDRLIECKADINKCRDDGASPVYIACEKGHLSVLDRLIECKADINKCMDNGASPVYIACQEGHLSVLDRLIECKADINKCMDNGASPVYIACQEGHLSVLDSLIECKADINKCRDDGVLPVFIACAKGHLSVLDRLIECKADINKCWNDGASPVYIACQKGHLSVLDRLIECKADINKCSNDGTSPVYIACQEGHLSVLDRLIECKADINKCSNDGASPVFIACQEGHLSVLDRLIECKADINKCRDDGVLPVFIACAKGHLSVLDRLIECKADINKCWNDGASPVYIACQKGHLSVLDRLIECKADINKCSNDGTSPVYIACQEGHLSVLDRLIECKADINKCSNDGASPVFIACQEGHLSVLDRLIECKADINKCRDNGASPVFIACVKGHVNILNTLLESKADVNKCTEAGHSPLHVACYFNHIDVVLVLLKLYKKNKVMIDLCDDWGCTPLYWACQQGFVQIVTLLLQHGANPHLCNIVGKSPLQVADDNGHVDVVTAIKEFIPITV